MKLQMKLEMRLERDDELARIETELARDDERPRTWYPSRTERMLRRLNRNISSIAFFIQTEDDLRIHFRNEARWDGSPAPRYFDAHLSDSLIMRKLSLVSALRKLKAD